VLAGLSMYHSAVGVTSFLYIRQVTYQLRGDVKKNADLGGTRNCKLPLFVQGLFLESLDNTAKIFEK